MTPPCTFPEMSPRGTAVLGRDHREQQAPITGFLPCLEPSPQRPAETYRDGEISQGVVDVPKPTAPLQGVLHSDRCWLDLCRQPKDHLALRCLERPAISWGNIQLKAEGNSSYWGGCDMAHAATTAASGTGGRALVLK